MTKLKELLPEEREKVHVIKQERILSGALGSSMKGNQLKWKHAGKIVKLDCLGYEGIAEVMTSWLLRFSDIAEEQYVKYYTCNIYEDDRYLGTGCYSYDFLGDASEITFMSIIEKNMMSAAISYDDLRDLMLEVTGIDVKEYVDRILCLDAITRNDDRHFGNMGFKWDGSEYKPLPIFDNGGSCLSDTILYPMNIDFDKNYMAVQAKPFNIRFEAQIGYVKRIGIKYEEYINSMDLFSKEARRAAAAILRGLEETRGIAWENI